MRRCKGCLKDLSRTISIEERDELLRVEDIRLFPTTGCLPHSFYWRVSLSLSNQYIIHICFLYIRCHFFSELISFFKSQLFTHACGLLAVVPLLKSLRKFWREAQRTTQWWLSKRDRVGPESISNLVCMYLSASAWISKHLLATFRLPGPHAHAFGSQSPSCSLSFPFILNW